MTTTTYVRHADPTFQDLNNYGTWVNIPDYGTVWKPYDENNWQPYADGQWVWTDQGWMWDSNEPYGWIVYHYGYWQFTDYDGWFWIPGYDWSPARVDWYRSNGYVGWAPAPPPNAGVTVIYNDVYVNRVWVVVPEGNFAGGNARQYRNRSYVPGATVLRSNNGGRGPDVRDIENVSHRRIDPVQPTREQVKSGNRQLERVRVQNNAPVSPSTIRNQPQPVRTPPTDSQGGDRQRPDRNQPVNPQKPDRTQPANPPTVNPPAVNPQTPASKPPEINDRRPDPIQIQKQPEEKNDPGRQIDNTRVVPKGNPQDNKGTNNQNQNNPVRNNSGRNRSGNKKQPAPVVAPKPVPNRVPNSAPVPVNDKNNNNDKNDRKKEKPDEGK